MNHPENEAIALCSYCRTPICKECCDTLQGEIVCKRCKYDIAAKLEDYSKNGQPEAPGRSFTNTVFSSCIRSVIRIAIIAIILGAILFVTHIFLSQQNPNYVYVDGRVISGGDGKPIKLENNTSAANPTYAQLMNFLQNDPTDEEDYSYLGSSNSYMCADFARDVHNDAEAAGIKAGFVTIEFVGEDVGHAIDVFQTADEGLVYIDCTGGTYWGKLEQVIEGYTDTSYDTIAYLEKGEPYGRIAITKAESTAYSFYEDYMSRWASYRQAYESYNQEVIAYNQEIQGKTYYVGTKEWSEIKAWESKLIAEKQALDSQEAELGDYWFDSGGIVEDIQVRW